MTVAACACFIAASIGGSGAASAQGDEGGDLDRRFVTVGERIPEFGGAYVDRDGKVRVWLVEPGADTLSRAVGELRAVVGEPFTAEATQDATAVRADFAFVDLWQWKQVATGMLGQDGLRLVDIDDTRNRLTLGVSEEGDRTALLGALTRGGVPEEAVRFVTTSGFEPSPGGGSTTRRLPVVGAVVALAVVAAAAGLMVLVLRRRAAAMDGP